MHELPACGDGADRPGADAVLAGDGGAAGLCAGAARSGRKRLPGGHRRDLRRRRWPEPGDAAFPARAAAARRLRAGGAGVAGAAGLRGAAAAAGDPGAERHRCLLRGHVRLQRHRRHRAHRAGRSAAVGERLALLPAAGGRPGHHRAGGGHPAAAGRGRRAAVQDRDDRPDEGRALDAAHRRDGARPVGGVLRGLRGLLLRLPLPPA